MQKLANLTLRYSLMFKKFIEIIVVLIFFLGIWYLVHTSDNYFEKYTETKIKVENEKLVIFTSIYPYAELTKMIVGTSAKVTYPDATKANLHEFEPLFSDIQNLNQADMVILNGLNIDAWAVQWVRENNKSNVLVLSDETGVNNTDTNAHYWLDPEILSKEITLISEKIGFIDPTNAFVYEANAEEIVKKINELDTGFRDSAINCKHKVFVSEHGAFGLFAKSHGLDEIVIIPNEEWSEVSPALIEKIKNIIMENQIKFVFRPPNSNSGLAETLASETGVDILPLDPIEAPLMEEESGDFFDRFQKNLDNLLVGLECETIKS